MRLQTRQTRLHIKHLVLHFDPASVCKTVIQAACFPMIFSITCVPLRQLLDVRSLDALQSLQTHTCTTFTAFQVHLLLLVYLIDDAITLVQ